MSNDLRAFAFRTGFAVLKHAFEPARMEALEFNIAAPDQRDACVDEVRAHKGVMRAAAMLVGDTLIDTGERVVNHMPLSLYTDWHRDDPHIEQGIVMPAWRFALYFRDYTTHSGGLQVWAGSHLSMEPEPNGRLTILSMPGDIVLWNLRTLHAAGANNEDRPVASPRNAIFFDYAAPDPAVERYIAWRAQVKRERDGLGGTNGYKLR